MSFHHRRQSSGKYHQVTMTGTGTNCTKTKVLHHCLMPSSTHKPLCTVLHLLYSMHRSANCTFYHQLYSFINCLFGLAHFARTEIPLWLSLVKNKRASYTGKITLTSSTLHNAFTQLQFVLWQVLVALALQMIWSVCHLMHLKGILYIWEACHSQSCRLPVASSLPGTQLCIQDRMYRRED